jgi:hypothetical protein
MIGQRCVQQQIKAAMESKSLAHFIILVGEKGSGRKTLAKEVAKWLKAEYAEVDKGVDAIRAVIDDSYSIATNILYVIDGDSMSSASKNALLKITEEPPKTVWFVLTVVDIGQTLETLTSRACVYRLDNYTHQDISQFAGSEDWRFPNFCSNKYEVDLLLKYGIDEFHKFVKLAVDNIDYVSGANALKIEDRIAFKDTDETKYDMKIFLQAFRTECIDRVQQFDEYPDKMKYLDWIDVTTEKLAILRTPTINKQALFDMWVFDIRAVGYAER